MKKSFTHAAATDRDAFQLGMQSPEALLNSGLIAKSNAAVTMLDDLLSRKARDKSFDNALHMQMIAALNDISAEMDWLDEQIRLEVEAIAGNTLQLDFIATLDESNMMTADGSVRDDVQSLLSRHGYDDVEGLEAAEVMLIVQAIEHDLHNDNTARQDRIEDYETRHGELRDRVRDYQDRYGEVLPSEVSSRMTEIEQRQPYDATMRTVIETAIAEPTSVATSEVAESAASVSDTFKPF